MGGVPIVQYWHSEQVPDEVAELIATFRDLNPEFRHLLFDEASAARFIEEQLDRRTLRAFRSCAVPAMQADYFRCCAVWRLGGVYADADLGCLRPLAAIFDDLEEGELAGWARLPNGLPDRWADESFFGGAEKVGEHRLVDNSFFAFRFPHHPFLKLALDFTTANLESRVAEDIPLTTGPGVFTSIYLLRQLGSFDAFLEYTSHGILAATAPLLCETAGSFARVEEAFEGVRIVPHTERQAWIENTANTLEYKRSGAHWMQWRSSIFR